MNKIDASTIVPNFVVGVLVVITGVMIIINRKRLNGFIFKSQETMLGKKYARVSAGRQTPFMMGTVGCGFILVGSVMIFAAIAGIVQSA